MKVQSGVIRGHSLTGGMLARMVMPMALLAILLGVGGSWAIQESVEAVNDRILGAASRAIADSLTFEDGEIALNLSPAIFGMLEDNARDNVFYSVRQSGHLITGYGDLPDIAPNGLQELQVTFGKADYHGAPVRVVAEGRRLPGTSQPVVIEVAETLTARQRTTRSMLEGLALLEAVLIGLTAVLLPVAVRLGMRPVVRLGGEMDQRVASDLTPLPLSEVPTELQDLVRAFNRMLGRLDSTLQNMRRFTADASHQLRTPLSILRTHIALLRKAAPGSAEARETIDEIGHAIERLERLVVQLLALAKADSVEPEDIAREPVGANALAQAVAAEHVPDALRAGIELHFESDPDVPDICTQPMLAAELLGNLIDNAIRYNRKGGNISVQVREASGGVLIAIEDDGPGIAPIDRERAFTRFTRLDRNSGRPGSGLGLPIAAMLARALGAQLRLETARSGQGLRAEVHFPLNEGHPDSIMKA
ncbi:MAG: sensor histidine kinase [Sphingomonadales bacterium]|nr:sensor histidine kinase [Sphingomonadales bacterium]MDE2568397.1 sensor histidine kinase [Sphingomonadales bacterium]